jgi:hypothetical protein
LHLSSDSNEHILYATHLTANEVSSDILRTMANRLPTMLRDCKNTKRHDSLQVYRYKAIPRNLTFSYGKKCPKFNLQQQSLLFKLPPELRLHIYELLASSWNMNANIHVLPARGDEKMVPRQNNCVHWWKLTSFCYLSKDDPELEIRPWSGDGIKWQNVLGPPVLPACFPCYAARETITTTAGGKGTSVSILNICKR